MKSRLKKIVVCALFAAFICIAGFISVPLPMGYANCGDIVLLVGAYLLGPVYGAAAAGIGAAFTDLFMGFGAYIPGTFVIKALMALACAGISSALMRKKDNFIIGFAPGAVLAEIIMILGYYLYESLVLGYGFGTALASIPGNAVQALAGAIGAVILANPVKKLVNKTGIL
ncbi:MAG: ECF transporter S component [Clostridia bacterium]|nr:ECF transporter S component [Clostridia bacterium]